MSQRFWKGFVAYQKARKLFGVVAADMEPRGILREEVSEHGQ
jgi:hypothetical protein